MVLMFPIANSAFADKAPTTLEVFLIYSTPNTICDMKENEKMKIFEQSTKLYLEKFASDKQTKVSYVCTHVDELRSSEFPLLLQRLNIQRPDLLIFVGNANINKELVIIDHAFGKYACLSYDSDVNCTTNLIYVCNDCEVPMYKNEIDTHVWTLSHEISHYLLFNKYPDKISKYWLDGVHDLQSIYDECYYYNEFDPCEGMYYTQNINGKSIRVMNFDFILKNPTPLENFDRTIFAYAQENNEIELNEENEMEQNGFDDFNIVQIIILGMSPLFVLLAVLAVAVVRRSRKDMGSRR